MGMARELQRDARVERGFIDQVRSIDDQGQMTGSVSGGCIEGAVVQEALDVISEGKPRLLEFGVSNDEAWEVGLACGGKIQVFVEKID